MEREKLDESYNIAALEEELEICCGAITDSEIHQDLIKASRMLASSAKPKRRANCLGRLAKTLKALGRRINFVLS